MPARRLISHAQWVQFNRDSAFLQALRNGGVDNWDWFSEAYNDYIKSTKGKDWAEPADEDFDD